MLAPLPSEAQSERLAALAEKYPPEIVDLIEAAMDLPRYTPGPGGNCTEHPFRIRASSVWALDGALAALDIPTNRAEQAELHLAQPGLPDDIRGEGWAVAVHNDYRLKGVHHTFWLFTKGDRNVKGEGHSDAEALNAVRTQLGLPLRTFGQ